MNDHRCQRPALKRAGGRLIIFGAIALLLWCAYDVSIRFQDLEAWLSGVRTMSRLKEESFIGNLLLIFRDEKMQAMGYTMLYLSMGIILGIFCMIPWKGIVRTWISAVGAASLAFFAYCRGIISPEDPLKLLRALPFFAVLAGRILIVAAGSRRIKEKKGPDPLERIGRIEEQNKDHELKIMVSACLIGKECKYSGGSNLNEDVLSFLEGKLVIPVCPEVMGGLRVPRPPCEISGGKVITEDGRSMEEPFRKGAMKCIAIARKERPDMVILKENSPSCGVRTVYDGTFSGRTIPGRGIFAEMVVKEGIPVLTEKDLTGYGKTIGAPKKGAAERDH